MSYRARLFALALEPRDVPALFTVMNTLDAGVGSLRQAVLDANALAGADTIQFSALFDTPQIINLTSGELPVTDSVQVTGPANAALITVSGGGSSRVFNVNGPGTLSVSMSGITIANGKAVDNGGGIYVDDESLTLTNVVLNGNSAPTNGGAVFVNVAAGSLTAADCQFTNNSAKYGGAIARTTNGSVSLTRCSLTGNNAIFGDGGAIYMNQGSLTVVSSLIANNTAANNGGGASTVAAMPKALFSNSTIANNTAGGVGGGIYNDHYFSTLQILNCTVANNTAMDGSGVYNGWVSGFSISGMVITSSIVATNFGGSDLTHFGSEYAHFYRSIIGSTNGTGPGYDHGGNFFGVDPGLAPLANNGGATLTHGLLLGSAALDAGVDQSPTLGTDQRGAGFPRLIGPAVDIGAFENALPLPTGLLTPVPPIVSPGPTPNTVTVTYTDPNFSILGSSIDINDIQILDPSNNPLTITSFSPPVPGNSNPLAITYTFTPPSNLVVNQWDNSDNGTYTVKLIAAEVSNTKGVFNVNQTLGTVKAFMSTTYTVFKSYDVGVGIGFSGDLRYCINKANADLGPSIINFDPALFATSKTITLALGELAVTAAVTVNGPTAVVTVNAGMASRIFNVNDTSAVGSIFAISNMKLVNGVDSVGGGGAILMQNDSLSLTNCTLSNNTSNQNGGAIKFAVAGGALNVTNCTVSNNSATGTAAGLGYGGAFEFHANTAVVVLNSTLSGNTSARDGGAMCFYNTGSLLMTNTSVTGNTAATGGNYSYGGGGLNFFGAATGPGVVISGCTFSGNDSGNAGAVAPLFGGGGAMAFVAVSGNIVIENSTVSGNTANAGAGRGYGGGIMARNLGGTNFITIRNSTIVNNDAGRGGGGIAIAATGPQSVSSTIIAQNTLGGVTTAGRADLASAAAINITGNNNLIGVQDASTQMTFTGTGNQTGTAATPLDAKLGALASNGGPTQTRALLAGSPAIDTGTNPSGLLFDQRGFGYARAYLGKTDIGAFEVQSPPAKVTNVLINSTLLTAVDKAQRSRVIDVAIMFDSQVTFLGGDINAAAAFTLNRVSTGDSVTLAAAVNNTGPGTVVTLTFIGGPLDNISLQNGRYALHALAAQFTSGLDGDGNGTGGDDFLFDEPPAPAFLDETKIFRFFGDYNHNGIGDAGDFVQLRLAMGNSAPPFQLFDFDNDGAVAASDFIRFRLQFGGSI